MAQSYAFSKENKGAVDQALDFPRLKLDKKGEKARLAIFGIAEEGGKRKLVLPAPEGGYFFDLRIPGAEREFVGSFECLASDEAKVAGEFEPEACPHCKVAVEGNVSEEVMRKRLRRMVLPVVRYKTAQGSSQLVTPPSVEVLAWRFTDRYFNVLVDEHEKWEASGGLLGHDITLTCEAVNYQNFVISVEPEAAYAKDKELGKLVLESYINQTAPLANGLIRQLGTSLNAVDLERKIQETIQGAAQMGYGDVAPAGSIPSVDQETIASMAADLLGGNSAAAEDVLVETPAEPEAEAETVTVAAAGSGEVDFDEFFST